MHGKSLKMISSKTQQQIFTIKVEAVNVSHVCWNFETVDGSIGNILALKFRFLKNIRASKLWSQPANQPLSKATVLVCRQQVVCHSSGLGPPERILSAFAAQSRRLRRSQRLGVFSDYCGARLGGLSTFSLGGLQASQWDLGSRACGGPPL